jgi:general secretion pathway protein A
MKRTITGEVRSGGGGDFSFFSAGDQASGATFSLGNRMDGQKALLDTFRFREHPFAPTADPLYFYATQAHKECLFRLWSSIDQRHGVAVVLGNYGTGKTTLLRKLITGMAVDKSKYVAAVVGSPIPSWTSFALLESIVRQFGLKPGQRSFASYMEALDRFLLDNRGRILTLIIDDAQNLNKRGQLELLRLVQNLETPQHKLLNLILFAQLEWVPVLNAAPNFEQRINTTFILSPLTSGETRDFVQFRLQQAGAQPGHAPDFDDQAIALIHAYSEGNPRVIVTLCRNILLVAGQLRTRSIGRDLVLHTVEKTTVPDPDKRARLARAILETAGHMKSPRIAAAGAPPALVPDIITERDERATRLLMRAARGKADAAT